VQLSQSAPLCFLCLLFAVVLGKQDFWRSRNTLDSFLAATFSSSLVMATVPSEAAAAELTDSGLTS
jgi:hypothetical protein